MKLRTKLVLASVSAMIVLSVVFSSAIVYRNDIKEIFGFKSTRKPVIPSRPEANTSVAATISRSEANTFVATTMSRSEVNTSVAITVSRSVANTSVATFTSRPATNTSVTTTTSRPATNTSVATTTSRPAANTSVAIQNKISNNRDFGPPIRAPQRTLPPPKYNSTELQKMMDRILIKKSSRIPGSIIEYTTQRSFLFQGGRTGKKTAMGIDEAVQYFLMAKRDVTTTVPPVTQRNSKAPADTVVKQNDQSRSNDPRNKVQIIQNVNIHDLFEDDKSFKSSLSSLLVNLYKKHPNKFQQSVKFIANFTNPVTQVTALHHLYNIVMGGEKYNPIEYLIVVSKLTSLGPNHVSDDMKVHIEQASNWFFTYRENKVLRVYLEIVCNMKFLEGCNPMINLAITQVFDHNAGHLKYVFKFIKGLDSLSNKVTGYRSAYEIMKEMGLHKTYKLFTFVANLYDDLNKVDWNTSINKKYQDQYLTLLKCIPEHVKSLFWKNCNNFQIRNNMVGFIYAPTIDHEIAESVRPACLTDNVLDTKHAATWNITMNNGKFEFDNVEYDNYKLGFNDSFDDLLIVAEYPIFSQFTLHPVHGKTAFQISITNNYLFLGKNLTNEAENTVGIELHSDLQGNTNSSQLWYIEC